MNQLTITSLLLAGLSMSKVYFEERFDYTEGSKDFAKKWSVPSNFGKNADGQPIELGEWELTKGAFWADEKINRGLQTKENMHFYAMTSKLATPFNNKDKTLVFQFTVKHEQILDCGGGYLKLLPADMDVDSFNGDSPYFLMFGPDVCGNTRRVHCILSYKEKNYLIKKDITPPSDKLTHLYTFVLKPDQTYEILIDNAKSASGTLFEDWDFLPAEKLADPKASKPADWVEQEFIVDAEDKKPAGWDEIPEFIPDTDATKPEEWDDDIDGIWSAPMISNSEYRGEWSPRNIKNPEYKGEWAAPLIDNPDFKPDFKIYEMKNIGHVAFDLWQVTAGTIFDNILLTDDLAYAKKMGKEVWENLKDMEKEEEDKHHQKIIKQAAKEAEGVDKSQMDPQILKKIEAEEAAAIAAEEKEKEDL